MIWDMDDKDEDSTDGANWKVNIETWVSSQNINEPKSSKNSITYTIAK
jgi:hypothetical protein